MIAWFFLLLLIALLFFFLWRAAEHDAAFWKAEANLYRDRLYEEWLRQWGWANRANQDDADWWKE